MLNADGALFDRDTVIAPLVAVLSALNRVEGRRWTA